MQIFFGFIILLTGTLIFVGVYQFAMGFGKAPPVKVTKTLRSVTAIHRSAAGRKNGFWENAADFISHFIRVNEIKRSTLENSLKIAGMTETPELYYAGAVTEFLKYSLIAVAAGLFFSFTIPIFAVVFLPLLLILAVMKTGKHLYRITDKIREKRRQIDMDLPRFVYSIVHEIDNNHDVLSIFERHKNSFSKDFEKEVTITISDMRSGSYEAALQRFESRIGSGNLSEVVCGLIEMTKGNDTHVYWETLAFRFSEMQKQMLRREAQKIPAKVHVLSLFLFLSLGLVYAVVIVMVIFQSAQTFM